MIETGEGGEKFPGLEGKAAGERWQEMGVLPRYYIFWNRIDKIRQIMI